MTSRPARHTMAAQETADENFTMAVHLALQHADARQVNLFDKMFGKPHENAVVKLPPAISEALAREASKKRLPKPPKPISDDEAATGMELGEFLNMVNNEIDYRQEDAPILPDAVRAQLEQFREDFSGRIAGVKDMPGLMKCLERYITKEHELLFYRTNDYMSASIKLDYFTQFIDQLCIRLKDAGKLDSDQLDRFEELERFYRLGLDSYQIVNAQIEHISGGECHSILGEARVAFEEQIRESFKDKPAEQLEFALAQPIPIAEMEKEAHSVVRDVLKDAYQFEGKYRVPPPMLPLILNNSRKLAMLQMSEANPRLDFRDPDLKHSAMLTGQYLKVMNGWKAKLAGLPGLQDIYQVHHDITKQLAHYQNLPPNFNEMVLKAKEAAAKAMTDGMRTAFSDYQASRPYPRPHTYEMLKNLDTMEYLVASMRPFRMRMRGLTKFDDKYDLLHTLEAQVDMLVGDVAHGGTHMAAFFAAKTYYEALRKHLGDALLKAGCHDVKFLGQLKEVESKLDLAHENQREISHWVMEDTSGGHDNGYTAAWMTLGTEGREISLVDKKRYYDNAVEGDYKAAIERGVPEPWAAVPYMPLILARCRDIAQAQVAREVARGDMNFADVEKPRINQSWVDLATGAGRPDKAYTVYDERTELEPEAVQLISKVNARALSIFRNAVTCLMPQQQREEFLAETKARTAEYDTMPDGNGPDSLEAKVKKQFLKDTVAEIDKKLGEFPIEPSIHNLKIVLEFLDHKDKGLSQMQMN